MTTKILTQSRLKELLEYNQLTGEFTHKTGKHKDKVAGCIQKKSGYVMIGIDKKKYPAHRLAWLYVEGYFPLGFDVDHKDRIRHHNEWKNLQLKTRSCNLKNRFPQSGSSGSSGSIPGVSSKGNKFQAYVNVNEKRVHLGTFDLYSDAVLARYEAECKFYSSCQEYSLAEKYLQEQGLI
jgi:hypothetical protein